MFRVFYTVPIEQREAEEEWLKTQLIVHAIELVFDWDTRKQKAKFGMIIPKEVLTMIKLRHVIDTQLPYTLRR